MKTFYHKLLYTALPVLFTALFFLSACKKDYLTDGGISSAKTSLTTFDYLQQHQYHMFDTLTTILLHYNLKNEVNNAKTFFAPDDYSINRYLKYKTAVLQLTNENSKFTMDSLYAHLTADSLRQYMFNKPIQKSDFTDNLVHPMVNLAGTTFGVQRVLATDPAYYLWSGEPVYLLYYVKIRGTLDVVGQAATPDNPLDIAVLCQTTGIETSSGGILHVLANTHTFQTF